MADKQEAIRILASAREELDRIVGQDTALVNMTREELVAMRIGLISFNEMAEYFELPDPEIAWIKLYMDRSEDRLIHLRDRERQS